MTDPTADAAELLPCHDNEWHAVGPGTPLNVWLETKRDGEDGANVCFCRLLFIGDEPKWIEQPPYGRTTVTHHTFAPPTHWRWNTRPQPAPPAGEPDFKESAREYHRTVAQDVNWYLSQVAEFGRRMYRLGVAARPKIEDAEKKDGRQSFLARVSLQGKAIAAARLVLEENVTIAANAIVALIDSERADVEAKLGEREAELAKADAAICDHFMCGKEIQLLKEPWLSVMEKIVERHAARQQQKDMK